MISAEKFLNTYNDRPKFHVGPVCVAKILTNGKLWIHSEFMKSPGIKTEDGRRLALWMQEVYLGSL